MKEHLLNQASTEELKALRQLIDERLQHEEAKARLDALNAILQSIEEFSFKPGELFPNLNLTPAHQTRKLPILFKDPITGASWSGRGKTPRWLNGKNPEDFRVCHPH